MPKATTQFRRGTSGNPKGRPRSSGPRTAIEIREVRSIARRYGAVAIHELARMAGLVAGTKAARNESARIVAIRELLDRGYGRPAQMVSGDTTAPLIVDFRWSNDTTSAIPAPAQPMGGLVIDAVVELTEAEDANAETPVPSVNWSG